MAVAALLPNSSTYPTTALPNSSTITQQQYYYPTAVLLPISLTSCYVSCSLKLSDLSRLSTLINMMAADLADSIADSGHNYALTHSAAGLSEALYLTELTSGLTQVYYMI